METEDICAFAVRYLNNTKIVQSSIADLIENIGDKFASCPRFPERFRIQYQHFDLKIFVDLDELEELHDRGSNVLNIIAEESGDEADKSSSASNASDASNSVK